MMIELPHTHLCTLELTVDFAAMIVIGKVPAGLRRIAPVKGGRFSGNRLNGDVLPGADWVINRVDGPMLIDVRLPLKTDDGAMIYLGYQGRFLAAPEDMARFARGALLEPEDYSLVISAKFECGDERYRWLNDMIAVGTGTQTTAGPRYEIFSIGQVGWR